MIDPSSPRSATRGDGARRRFSSNLPVAGRHLNRAGAARLLRRLRAFSDAVDDSVLGDVIGAASLFLLLFLGLFAGLVFGG